MAVKRGIYIKDAQQFLDECIKTRELVSVVALKKDGSMVRYDGWQVISSFWKRGTHTLCNPKNQEKRRVRDVLIFEINNHPIYL